MLFETCKPKDNLPTEWVRLDFLLGVSPQLISLPSETSTRCLVSLNDESAEPKLDEPTDTNSAEAAPTFLVHKELNRSRIVTSRQSNRTIELRLVAIGWLLSASGFKLDFVVVLNLFSKNSRLWLEWSRLAARTLSSL